jgi:hypothetical protein
MTNWQAWMACGLLMSLSAAAAVRRFLGGLRLYGGIHWSLDNEDGLAGGRALGQHVFATQLRPIPEPATWLLIVDLVGCLAGRRSGRIS